MGIRQHYMTLVYWGNLCVTCKVEDDDKVYAHYEKVVNGEFKTTVLDMKNNIVYNRGFNTEEMRFIIDFNMRHLDTLEECARGWSDI